MHEQKSPKGAKTVKQRLSEMYLRFCSLQGDPHHLALGMAIGVFVSLTPTIPFHTIIAVALAFLLRASKPAAAIGVWFSNPLTAPPFYIYSYKLGALMIGLEITGREGDVTIRQLFQQGMDIILAMVAGGALLGVVPAVVSYFAALFVFRKIRTCHSRSSKEIYGDI